MAANSAGIYGHQLFRADDKPLYHRGLAVNAALIGAALTIAIALASYLRFRKFASAASLHKKESEDNFRPRIEDDERHDDSGKSTLVGGLDLERTVGAVPKN